ncbi:MAG TPA: FxsA family protein [Alphaproteobacteria bacterium]|nr:FxsA family protein [Alphaproteobacteria bacterium]
MALILLAVLILPFVEIAVFIQVGEWIGVWPTIGLTILSTMAGIALMRRQGLALLTRAREVARRGEAPVDEMLDGLCVLLGGALLIVPGFVTDALGLLLFVPWIQHRVRRRVWRTFQAQDQSPHPPIIDAEYAVIEKESATNESPSSRQVGPRLGHKNNDGGDRP